MRRRDLGSGLGFSLDRLFKMMNDECGMMNLFFPHSAFIIEPGTVNGYLFF